MGGVKTIDMRAHGNKTKVLTQNKNKHMASKTNHRPCANKMNTSPKLSPMRYALPVIRYIQDTYKAATNAMRYDSPLL